MSTVHAEPDHMRLAAEVEYIFRVACRLTGNSHDAEDLVQDVCERALRKAPTFATAGDCRRWLLRVLFNLFVDGTRHRHRSPIVAQEMADGSTAVAVDADPEDLACRSESEHMLTRAWGRLEPVQQVLLLLRAEGHDLGEIARITEIEKSALSSRLHRARSSLAKHIKQERSARSTQSMTETA